MNRSRPKQANTIIQRTPTRVDSVTISAYSVSIVSTGEYLRYEEKPFKTESPWTMGTTQEIKLYGATTLFEDMTELVSIGHRTEAKVDEIKTILEKMAEKLEVNTDRDLEQDEMMCLDVSDDEAQKMIIEYMKGHERAWPQDISFDLRLDFGQVMRITKELLNEGVLGDIESE